jgi:hypothetical protein
MDWSNQPDPFRRFEGCERILLPLLEEDDSPVYESVYNLDSDSPKPADFASIGQLFELSLALSAWKEYQGSRWALRINPSSGNLHPTEGYLILGPVHDKGLPPAPGNLRFTITSMITLEVRTRFAEAVAELVAERIVPHRTFLDPLARGLKYGERAFRYCNHDAGHALAALRLSASSSVGFFISKTIRMMLRRRS